MDLILLEKVENLGEIGDQVKVKSGYGRNYLLPQGKALLATSENVTRMEALRSELEAKANAELGEASARAEKLTGLVVTVESRVGPEGKLFGSVGPIDIAEALAEMGHDVQRSEIRMTDGAIRVAGEHQAMLHLHSDVNVAITIQVAADGSAVVIDPDEEESADIAAPEAAEEPATEE
ncbi:MAG: 50S ribosomal protein L9 [Proteobacteria bacterium]|nr:50S ribosomal protein L9 [Pseudomonadota bacterium]MCH8958460.1 50S ribosomal protein L9 [Pseudomonadota bacterium]